MKAVDTHADLLRAAVATANNDHRLGANEAPPAIISIFLGEQLTGIIDQIEKGATTSSKGGGTIRIDVSSLPPLPRDATDRNRTSPLAFTGNKFEFRAVGSSQSCAGANVVMNTIVAESIDQICARLEADLKAGKKFNESLQKVLQDTVKKHKRVVFNGDNYTEAWRKEAEKRGLPHLKKTPEALKALVSPKAIALFGKYEVLNERELKSRYEVYQHAYDTTVRIESECSLTIARTMILPAAVKGQRRIAEMIRMNASIAGCKAGESKKYLADVCGTTEDLLKGIRRLERAVKVGASSLELLDGMADMRIAADELEGLLPEDVWPLPSYAEMMFMT
jgi:glutamine synthetase